MYTNEIIKATIKFTVEIFLGSLLLLLTWNLLTLPVLVIGEMTWGQAIMIFLLVKLVKLAIKNKQTHK